MTTSLKVILAAAAVTVLASPVMAQSEILPFAGTPYAHAAPSTAYGHARGSVSHPRASRVMPFTSGRPVLDDCVHVTFPQCGGDSTQTEFDRP